MREKLTCKNSYCQSSGFTPKIVMDTTRLIGLKCMNCQWEYELDEIEVFKNGLEELKSAEGEE